MKPFAEFPLTLRSKIRFVLSDVDDTLTDGPRLPAATYTAIERLQNAGITVIPVTAAPAGWCDLMARMWPVGAVIGENGGLCFRHDPASGETERHYWASPSEREEARARLAALAAEIVAALPGCTVAHDQRYREVTLAFRDPGDRALSEEILARLQAAGARTTVNSLWVLGWFGAFDKLAMTRRTMAELFVTDIDRYAEICLYIGDSPNDAPMFGFFPQSVGVATVRHYADRMPALPGWITEGAGGAGFVEIAEALLHDRA
ncbi:MAG TPA: HAD-IIB family hydrolase [Stellaceae bacterium]|nr:HAD-IIB family hydrolase [Stellaceae bacterium]